MKKVLTFRICKEWFEKLKKGIVENRFREDTQYWRSRLVDKNGNFKHFDEIEIINGYQPDSPQAKVEFVGISLKTNEEWKSGFEIKLGEIREIIESS